jgi:chaperone required for assembly of F1-ATPase
MRDLLTDFNEYLSDPDPVRRAQIAMKKPLPKRFYKQVGIRESEAGFAIELDGKTVKTPARRPLAVPTEALAALVAAEWDRQVDVINPTIMPVTRLVNTALDGVADDREPVFQEIVRFANSDLLCYRASQPQKLVERQSQQWGAVIAWAAEDIGARFMPVEGVIHQDQPPEAISTFAARLRRYDSALELASLHTVTSLTGSALLALAFAEGHLSPDEVWSLAHLDEDWTNEQWGSDAEAEHRRGARLVEFRAATDIFSTVRR